jgi:hypothetical protein
MKQTRSFGQNPSRERFRVRKVRLRHRPNQTQGVNFINILWAAFSFESVCFVQLFFTHSLALQFFSKRTSAQKLLMIVCEIDYRCQFHQHLRSRFFKHKCFVCLCLKFGFVILYLKNMDTKAARKMSVNLTTGLLRSEVASTPLISRVTRSERPTGVTMPTQAFKPEVEKFLRL